jgi:hypothetical protein
MAIVKGVVQDSRVRVSCLLSKGHGISGSVEKKRFEAIHGFDCQCHAMVCQYIS